MTLKTIFHENKKIFLNHSIVFRYFDTDVHMLFYSRVYKSI